MRLQDCVDPRRVLPDRLSGGRRHLAPASPTHPQLHCAGMVQALLRPRPQKLRFFSPLSAVYGRVSQNYPRHHDEKEYHAQLTDASEVRAKEIGRPTLGCAVLLTLPNQRRPTDQDQSSACAHIYQELWPLSKIEKQRSSVLVVMCHRRLSSISHP